MIEGHFVLVEVNCRIVLQIGKLASLLAVTVTPQQNINVRSAGGPFFLFLGVLLPPFLGSSFLRFRWVGEHRVLESIGRTLYTRFAVVSNCDNVIQVCGRPKLKSAARKTSRSPRPGRRRRDGPGVSLPTPQLAGRSHQRRISS